jgi:cell division protein FtsQ
MNSADMPLDVKLMAVATQLLLGVFAVLCLVALGNWLMRQPLWAVKSIVVDGDVTHQSAVAMRAQLAAPLRPRLQPGFLALDLQPVRELFEDLPWVRQAVVRREFPNRLRVTLREHQAVAWWNASGSGQLVDTDGTVFDASPDDGDNLPELAGPDGQAARVLALYRTLAPELERLELGLERLELTDRGAWRARLDSGAVVELGRGTSDELLARLNRFTATLSQLDARYAGALQSVDLRYPNGYALRVRGVTTLADPLNPNRPAPVRVPTSR